MSKSIWLVRVFPQSGDFFDEVAFTCVGAYKKKEFYKNTSKVEVSGPYVLRPKR